ncbi:MAG: hypothetical protein ACE5GC_00875 [Acidimicrobiia bacterium]
MSEPQGRREDFEELVDLVEGRLDPDAQERVAARLAKSSPRDEADIQWLRGLTRLLASTDLVRPPRRVRQRLLRTFESYAQGERAPSLVRRLIATPMGLGGPRPAFAGVRGGAGEAGAETVVFASEIADIVLTMETSTTVAGFDVRGQVLPLDDTSPADYAVQLVEDELEIQLTVADELGEFSFTGVDERAERIVLSSGDAEIVVPIGEDAA